MLRLERRPTRAADPATRACLATRLGAAYPQAHARPVDRPGDPADRRAGEQVAACTLGLAAPEYLPLHVARDLELAANLTARAIVGQSRSTIDPWAWVRDGALVVVDVAKEQVGADIAALLGGTLANLCRVLGPLDRALLDLVGRHAFVATDTLAAVLGGDRRWVRARRARLARRGLLRTLRPEEVTPPDLARWDLLELTGDGLRVLAAHMGLPLGMAVRYHGLAGGGPEAPLGPRAALLAHLPHTLGTDAVFADLARAARALRAAEVGQRTPLPALLTTTALLHTAEGGPLGCVWRTATSPARRKAWE